MSAHGAAAGAPPQVETGIRSADVSGAPPPHTVHTAHIGGSQASGNDGARTPLSQRAAALHTLTQVAGKVMAHTDIKLLRHHLMSVKCPEEDMVFAAIDAFRADGDVEALRESLDAFVSAEVARGSDVIGTPIVQHHRPDAREPRLRAADTASAVTGINAIDVLEDGTSSDDDARARVGAASASRPGVGSAGGRPPLHARRALMTADGRHARITGALIHAPTMDYSPAPGPYLSVTVVYYAPEMADVAKELAEGRARGAVALHEVDWKTFPDGFPNLMIRNIKDGRFNHVMFLASFHSPEAIMYQLPVIYALPTYSKHFSAVVPYFPTGTMERVQVIGEVATAKTLSRMMSATPMARAGPPEFAILDIHALAEQFYFSDFVHIRLKSCIMLLHDVLLTLPDAGNVTIAFPDEGAYKRFHGKLEATFGEPVVCTKRRDGDKRKIVINDGDPRGRHVVIVDDLVQTGGTLLECAKALREHGAAAVSCYVTHAVFPNDSWRRFISSGDGVPAPVANFFITNSIPTTAAKLKGVEPFRVLSITPVIEDLLGL